MCKLAAYPAGCTREEAINVMERQIGADKDGFGFAYIKEGEFVVKRYPYSLDEALKKGDDIFDHMPHKGWTIAHARNATHGGNTVENTHPFIVGDQVIAHNGMWSYWQQFRTLLEAQGHEFKGDTDSEVAARVLDIVGPEVWSEGYAGAGVYLALQKDGTLWYSKPSGVLGYAFYGTGKSYIIATSLSMASCVPGPVTHAPNGYGHFTADTCVPFEGEHVDIGGSTLVPSSPASSVHPVVIPYTPIRGFSGSLWGDGEYISTKTPSVRKWEDAPTFKTTRSRTITIHRYGRNGDPAK